MSTRFEFLVTANIATLQIVRAGTCSTHLPRVGAHASKSVASSHQFELSKTFIRWPFVMQARPFEFEMIPFGP